jgi:lysophospholipase L1-like esterase
MLSSEHWESRMNLFNQIPVEEGDIVFLGNSLFQNFLLQEYFKGNTKIKNRGISGDFTEGVLKRLDDVTGGKPAKIFLEIGINDLFERVPLDEVVSNYENILSRIKKETPSTKIYITSNLPTLNARVNEQVILLNEKLKPLTEKFNCTFINLHPLLLKGEKLNPLYAEDEVHLTQAGYAVWAKEIEKYVQE